MLSSRTLIVATYLLATTSTVRAQPAQSELQWVNGEWERYWRVLQLGGDVPTHPWSSRPFGPRELARLHAPGEHPWSAHVNPRTFRLGRAEGTTSPIEARTIVNSTFPFGYNEGPVWAGRGLTMAVQAGGAMRLGPLSAAFNPVFFEAQNARFELLPNGHDGRFAFGFPYPWGADMPQRFGDKRYRRLAPGNSFVRLDAGPVVAGFATAAQHWGPARDHPLVLGSNAGGFPHVFLGSAHPLRAGPLRLHGKMMWGRLSQSRFTLMDLVERHRFAAGAVFIVSPVHPAGLEIGGSRFVHVLWSDDVITRTNLMRPFAKLLGTKDTNSENQVASLFARWVFPEGGVEAYAEFAREDGNLNFRHLTLEPDHAAGYLFGVQRAWKGNGAGAADSAAPRTGSPRRAVVRAEVLNTRSTTPHLIGSQTPFYTHSPISQGHTYLGMALGSAGGFGGGAASIAYDRYTPRGRWSVTWTRLMRAEYLTSERGWVPIPQNADVFHALGLDGVVFQGRHAIMYELTGVYELNRNFQRDAFNLRAASGFRFAW